jgi:hypothetical protein
LPRSKKLDPTATTKWLPFQNDVPIPSNSSKR